MSQITINLIFSPNNHKMIKDNMVKSFKEAGVSYVINGDIEKYDYIYSLSKFIDTNLYKEKKFIFGPQFSNFTCFKKICINNSIYIQPSDQSVNVRKALGFNYFPITSYPVGIDTKKYNTGLKDGLPFIYFKFRNPYDVNLVKDFMKSKNINYHFIVYSKYKHDDYINILKHAPYGIWVGANESQGFAVQEALSCDVPLFIWNISKRGDEYPLNREKIKVKNIPYSTVPYWDKNCGYLVYDFKNFTNNFDKFLSNLNLFNPRKFILNNLSLKKQGNEFVKIYKNIKNYNYQFYLIWNHGLQYLDEIKKTIYTSKTIKLIKEVKKDIQDIEKFIKKLYELDIKNKSHISNKTKYLLKQKHNIVLLFVKNLSCNQIEFDKIKWLIREKFNPRFSNSLKHPHPNLPPGITHEHVIHGSDHEKETEHILKYFNITIP